ncbi:MAG TPA: methyltransferase [Acidimicrobiales bacterium]
MPGSPSHYFDPSPRAPSRPGTVRLDLPDLSLRLRTDRGVFSPDRIDPGTKILLDTEPDGAGPDGAGGGAGFRWPDGAELLDLGCGYGPIALALAVRAPGCRVWAVDVNRRARDLARANAEAAGLDNVVVARPEDVPGELRFAAVWSNPPVRIGKPALHELLARWLGRLAPGGRARLVVHKHLGADSLHRWLEGEGWAVRRVRSRLGYRVLEVRGAGATEDDRRVATEDDG